MEILLKNKAGTRGPLLVWGKGCWRCGRVNLIFFLFFWLSDILLLSTLFLQDLQVKSSPPVQTTPPINSDPAIIQASKIEFCPLLCFQPLTHSLLIILTVLAVSLSSFSYHINSLAYSCYYFFTRSWITFCSVGTPWLNFPRWSAFVSTWWEFELLGAFTSKCNADVLARILWGA